MIPSKTVRLGNKEIGPDRPVYIVFEAGPTHDGLSTAQKLVDIAAEMNTDPEVMRHFVAPLSREESDSLKRLNAA